MRQHHCMLSRELRWEEVASPHKGLTQSKRPEPEIIVKHHCNYGEDGAITNKYENENEKYWMITLVRILGVHLGTDCKFFILLFCTYVIKLSQGHHVHYK